MTAQEIVKSIMEKQGQTNAGFATKLGITQQSLWDRLNNSKKKDLSFSTLITMLRMLGYKIQIVPVTETDDVGDYEVK